MRRFERCLHATVPSLQMHKVVNFVRLTPILLPAIDPEILAVAALRPVPRAHLALVAGAISRYRHNRHLPRTTIQKAPSQRSARTPVDAPRLRKCLVSFLQQLRYWQAVGTFLEALFAFRATVRLHLRVGVHLSRHLVRAEYPHHLVDA